MPHVLAEGSRGRQQEGALLFTPLVVHLAWGGLVAPSSQAHAASGPPSVSPTRVPSCAEATLWSGSGFPALAVRRGPLLWSLAASASG